MNFRCSFILLLASAACGDGSNPEGSDVNPDNVSSIVATDDVQESENDPGNFAETNSATENEKSAPITSIEFIETKHSFGQVFFPSESKFTFKFKNTGKFPLIIESATASCGCTVPNKPDKPIAPGATGEIDVLFRPKENQVGQEVEKKVTVTANTEPKLNYLTILATVLESM